MKKINSIIKPFTVTAFTSTPNVTPSEANLDCKQTTTTGMRYVVALLLTLVSGWAYAAEDVMTNPPTPICTAGDFLWEQVVDVTNLDGTGLPIVDVRLVRSGKKSFTIPGPYPAELSSAVIVSVDDTVAWDGYVGRMNSFHQPNERYRIIFLKNGILQVGTDWTGDELDDGINTGWESDDWRGSLNQDIFLPNGTDEIRIIHWSEEEFGMNDSSSPNSVVPVSICINSQPVKVSLGDRVWEDRNVNGIQDCEDTNGDGVIGNVIGNPVSDTGDECDAGIANVVVKLGQPGTQGTCILSGEEFVTGGDGLYLFENLVPGNYCVEFGKPPADFCDTSGFELGDPQFTAQNVGNDDAVDSDVDTGSGISDPVNLEVGETDRSVDAGIFCPAKIGDRVWLDDNENGIQDNGENGVEDVKVSLFECGYDMVAGTADDVVTGQMRNTGVDGMYMFGGEPEFPLDPGKYFVQITKPDGTEFTTPNVNGDEINSDCLPPDGITACVELGSRGINLNRDCGLIPPPPPQCDLNLDKRCRVETPPVSGNLECEAKIAASVLQYTGPGIPSEITVTGKDKNSQVVSSFDSATGILTVSAIPGDLGSKMTIATDSVAEVIHTSCSAPYVAGQPAPLDNPKGDPSVNWLVLSFVDKNGTSVSLPGDDDGMFTDSCTITPEPAPSCDTLKASDEKLSSLTFKYTGGGCDGINDQGDKSSCSGSINSSESVTVQAGKKVDNLTYPVNNTFVAPNGEFTIDPDKFNSNSVLVASTSGGTETNEFHTSCSQPLAVGDEFGSFTLAAINGQRGSTEVTYQYKVTNNGAPLTGIVVTDDLLGDIGTIPMLGTGASDDSLTRTVSISATTVNIGTAVGLLSDGSQCPASDSTTVIVVEPPVVGGECDGKVTDLVMKNLGGDAQVRVEQKKEGTVFDDFVPAGGEFSFSGTDKKDTLGTEISIFVNDNLNTKIHTSCSQPIGPGLVSGDFEVISGNSRNGGPLPPL